MKNLTLAALIGFTAAFSVAGAATMPANPTHAQLHTINNVNKYSAHTANNLSRYSRNECIRRGGVMVKQASNSQLVCVAKTK